VYFIKKSGIFIFAIVFILIISNCLLFAGGWSYEETLNLFQHNMFSPGISSGYNNLIHLAYLRSQEQPENYTRSTLIYSSYNLNTLISEEVFHSGDDVINRSPQIAVHLYSDGESSTDIPFIVWIGDETMNPQSLIYLSYRNGENSWISPFRFSSYANDVSYNWNPQIAIDIVKGSMWIVWEGWNGHPHNADSECIGLWYVYLEDLNNISIEDFQSEDIKRVEGLPMDEEFQNPSLAFDFSNSPVLVWEQYGVDENINFGYFINSAMWNHSQNIWLDDHRSVINVDPAGNFYYKNPEVIFEKNDYKGICVFEARDTANYQKSMLYSVTFTDNSWNSEDPQFISSENEFNYDPALGLLGESVPVVVWTSKRAVENTNYFAFASIYKDGFWNPSEEISHIGDLNIRTCDASGMDLSDYYGDVDDTYGYIFACWDGSRTNNKCNLYLNIYNNVPFSIVGVSPEPDSDNVPVDSSVLLSFSELLNLNSVNENNIEIFQEQQEIKWTYLYNVEEGFLFIVPENTLKFNSEVSVFIHDLVDIYGNPLYENQYNEFLFYTEEGDFLQEDDVYAWPNPVYPGDDVIHFHVELNQAGNVKIDIYDITGKLIDSVAQDFSDQAVEDISYDVSPLASNVYIFIVNGVSNSGNDAQVIKKFAVVK
jgi:hypothetical protein